MGTAARSTPLRAELSPVPAQALLSLKRLQDAIEDGDHIYAVIRGAAINNDGAAKVGLLRAKRPGAAGGHPEVDGDGRLRSSIDQICRDARDRNRSWRSHRIHRTHQSLRRQLHRTRGSCALAALKTNYRPSRYSGRCRRLHQGIARDQTSTDPAYAALHQSESADRFRQFAILRELQHPFHIEERNHFAPA